MSASDKQNDILSWEEYFMATAFLAARRSKDPNTQVGACIVDELNRIVGLGYNGFPRGCHDDNFPWANSDTIINPLDKKYMYVVHAEANAILNKNSSNIIGCRIYVALFPCNECAKLIIQSGIKEVVYMSDKHAHKSHTIAAKKMFESASVKYRQFIPSQKQIVIDFTKIDWEAQNQLPPSPPKNSAEQPDNNPTSTSDAENLIIEKLRKL